MLSIAMSGCKTKKMSRELQYERSLKVDSVVENRFDIRDLSVTDIYIAEFDSLDPLDRCAQLDRFAALDSFAWGKNVRRIVHIKRRNDIKSSEMDKYVSQVKDSLRVSEIVKNKASPDKGSQVVSIVVLIIVLVVIIFIIILVRKVL